VSEFEQDLDEARSGLARARADLLDLVRGLSEADFARGRRGQWTIRGVLDHVIQSDWYYVRLIHQLRAAEAAAGDAGDGGVASVAGAVDSLTRSREAIVRAAEGIDEETFYRLSGPGHQQYSVLSVLENVTLHDHEHSAQIRDILTRTSA
jgi:uncharacterized damage-inducible protein DinB